MQSRGALYIIIFIHLEAVPSRAPNAVHPVYNERIIIKQQRQPIHIIHLPIVGNGEYKRIIILYIIIHIILCIITLYRYNII